MDSYLLRWLPALLVAFVLLGYALYLRRKIRRAEGHQEQLPLDYAGATSSTWWPAFRSDRSRKAS